MCINRKDSAMQRLDLLEYIVSYPLFRSKGRKRSLPLLTSAILILSILMPSGLVGCGPSREDFEAVDYTPLPEGDWKVSTPEEQGLDPMLLAKLYYVADEPSATGPALLILFILSTLSSLIQALDPGASGTLAGRFFGGLLGDSVGRLLMILLAHAAGRMLGRKGDSTRTMRAVAFALVPQVIGLLGVLPAVGPLFSLAAAVMTVLAVWMALQEALDLRRLAAALIPILGFVVFVFAAAATAVLVGGTALTTRTLLLQLGLGAGP
jgi:hypothetical protein